ncbi:phage tail length tape measure family protein [Sinorhizobium meliloti]|uniref:phage tail length tape measure family protein n=1 Tax=Rhizobium meliloti TaxID=382 RepID=UPI0004813CFE|nr:phage tail length tape measure family protein [Sinorhizobium meliloti]MDE4619637.1 phage tail length tape measure family protein [Sinorhizobium meliloti]
MATDDEQLVLSISADTRQIQRQLKSLVGQTQANTKAIEAAFAAMGGSSAGAFDKIAANSNRAFTTAEQGAKRFQNAMRASSQHTSNMAAQLQDISVQLAGGQSPWLVGVQQISQMNLGAVGLRGTLSAIGGAAASILSPVNLVALAFIGLGGTAVQYFASLLSESDKSEKALQQQAQLIQKLAEEWGDAVPALREYADELERARKAAELNEGAQIVNDRTLADTRSQIEDANIAIADLLAQLRASGEETDTILSLQRAFNEFASAANDGSVKVADVNAVQDALAAAIQSKGVPTLSDFKEMFDQVSAAALRTSSSVQQVNEALAQAQARMNDPRTWRGANLIGNPEGALQGSSPDPDLPMDGPVPERRPLIELDGLPGEIRRSRGSGRSAAIREAEREKKAVVDLIAQLEFEQGLIGATNLEREKANALRRAGAAATPEQKAQIESLVETMYAERDAIKASQEAMEELANVGRDVLQGLAFDLLDGENRADAFANAISRLADRLLNSAFDGLFGGSAGTPRSGGLLGGAIIPGILHDGGQAGRDGYGHRRAVPASTFRGAPRFHNGTMGVGLGPSEVPAILEKGEIVLPKGAKVGSEGVNVTYAPQIDARGADAAAVARLEQVMARDRAEFESKTVAAIRNARSRGVKGV